jgi:hypothetical protein
MFSIAIIKTIILFNCYISAISTAKIYCVLTGISEVCNIFRVIPIVLLCKIVIDMHREFIKVNILFGTK